MRLNEKGLWRHIKECEKTGGFLPVYLIKGSEGYLKERYASLLVERAVPAGLEAFNLRKLDGEDADISQIALCTGLMPAMAPRSCTVVRDFDFDSLSDDERERLKDIILKLPESCLLIFRQATKGFSERAGSAKRLLSAIDEKGAVCELCGREQGELIRFIISNCEKAGRKTDRETALYLLSSVGEDMATLENECLKLCAYCDSVIGSEDIDAVCVKSAEAKAFTLIDLLLEGRNDGAFAQLSLLFSQRTEPSMILGALISVYVDMFRVKTALRFGCSPAELRRLFPSVYRSDFRLKRAQKLSSRFSYGELLRALELLADTDGRLKGYFDDKRLLLEKLLTELSEAGRGA